ncbi:MAG: FtsX-like permease family protein [Xanthomonadales bacterium]|nr:FtsX-like permease family protein [Xanthomonadales bacterium]
MSISLRMAWRNLWRHRRRTWLTTSAMVFSNLLLIFLISLQFGSYDMMIDNTLQTFSGYIQLQRQGYNENPKLRDSIPGISALAEQLRERLPAARVAARASAFALASSEQRTLAVQVTGVQPGREAGVSTFPGLIKKGRFLQADTAPEIVLGSVLARNLKVGVGDEITLLGTGRDGSFAAGVVTAVGIFESGSGEIDRSMAEVPLAYFQQTFSMDDHGHAIVLSAPSLDQSQVLLPALREALASRQELVVLDWRALNPGLEQAIQADLSSAWFMYGVLVVLVAFSVLNTQLMSVLERTREFGMIMALGIKPRRLASLVMLETALMALLGFALGIALGWLVAAYFHVEGFSYPGMEELGARFNLPGEMYPSLTPVSLLLGPAVVFLFCLLAAVYPALRLFRLQPIEAMRAA